MSSVNQQQVLVSYAAKAAIGVATLLVGAKFLAWVQTGSVSVLASLLDSLLDALASMMNLFVIRQAYKPADEEHRFGHGKAEALGSLAQTLLIAGSALYLFVNGISRLMAPSPLGELALGNGVMGIAIVLTLALIAFQKVVIRKTGSLAIASDSLHYQTDLLTCVGVLVGMNLTQYLEIFWLDSVMGIAMGGYILYTSFRMGKQALDILMDREVSEDIQEKILEIAQRNPYVLGVHDIRTRSSGLQLFIQLHLDMPGDLSLQVAHDEGLKISQILKETFPRADVMIHHDPV